MPRISTRGVRSVTTDRRCEGQTCKACPSVLGKGISSWCPHSSAELVQHDCNYQDYACDDGLVEARDALQREPVVDHPEQQEPDERADHAAAAARQRRAADDHRGEDVEPGVRAA